MPLVVKFWGGTKKAKRAARRLGLEIQGPCRQSGVTTRPTFTAYGTPSKPGGRIVVCNVACTPKASKAVRDEFVKDGGAVVWFYDRCSR